MNFVISSIKNSRILVSLVCFLSRAINSVIMFNSVKGNKNKLQFNNLVFFKEVKIIIKGNNNIIKINGKAVLRNLRIEITGDNNHLVVGEGVKFYEKGYILFGGNKSSITIGNKTTIGSANIFCAEGDTHISIGEDCMLGRDIRIITGDFHSVIDMQTNKRLNLSKNITIGDHVWVGYHASIMKGALISRDTIIASNAMVNKENFIPNVILAGVPSKIIKENINWDRRLLPMD